MSEKVVHIVEIEGVTSRECSVLQTSGEAGRTPTVVVHGILDNVRRWVTSNELARFGIDLPDRRIAPPAFDPDRSRSVAFGTVLRLLEGHGLLARFAQEGLPAVAFSYQDSSTLVADMSSAVEKLHRVVDWTLAHYRARSVNLVGHSRGGLICRHALLADSSIMTAGEFRRVTDRLISICTPHQGSRIADFAAPVNDRLETLDRLLRPIKDLLPADWLSAPSPWERLRQFVGNIGQLRPDSAEVLAAATSRMPVLPGGYYAIAGSVATFFACELPLVGRLRLPPAIDLPEFTDGLGDMAVSVTSAADVPEPDADRVRVLPVNHMTATKTSSVQDAVVQWVRRQ